MNLHHQWIGMIGWVMALAVRADFTPPKDGKLTEKQVTGFIEITKEQLEIFNSATKQAADASSRQAAKGIYGDALNQFNAAVVRNGMTKPEFDWVDHQFNEIWAPASTPFLQGQIIAHQADSTANMARIETCEQAQKEGKRVLTSEQRDAAIASATSDRDSLTAEIKTDQDAIKPISDEIAQHDKDASDAEAAAKAPPGNLSDDEKSAFIDQQKNDAQAAHDAAKDARERLGEAQKNLDDAKARLAIATASVNHPEVPATDNDSARVKTQNDKAIAEAKTAVSEDESAIKILKQTLAAEPVNLSTNTDKPDPDNLALVQKHLTEYMDAIGAGDVLKAK